MTEEIMEEKYEYICRQELIKAVSKLKNADEVLTVINSVPSEPIIQCKDCKYSSVDEYGVMWCNRSDYYHKSVFAWSYCSDGVQLVNEPERDEDEGDKDDE